MPDLACPSTGAVRIRTARLRPHTTLADLADTVRSLTLDALEPPAYAALAQLVGVDAGGEQIVVTLREPLASFALGHGCRTVAAHGHVHDGVQIATVVLTRHPEPVSASPSP